MTTSLEPSGNYRPDTYASLRDPARPTLNEMTREKQKVTIALLHTKRTSFSANASAAVNAFVVDSFRMREERMAAMEANFKLESMSFPIINLLAFKT